MKNFLKKNKRLIAFLSLTLFLFIGFGIFAQQAQAEVLNYVPLAPLPGIPADGNINLGAYLKAIFKFGIGLAIGGAVLMMIVGGFEYAVAESLTGKSGAKDRIQNALFGLLLALSSYLILYTLDPNFLKLDFFNKIKSTISGANPMMDANDCENLGGQEFTDCMEKVAAYKNSLGNKNSNQNPNGLAEIDCNQALTYDDYFDCVNYMANIEGPRGTGTTDFNNQTNDPCASYAQTNERQEAQAYKDCINNVASGRNPNGSIINGGTTGNGNPGNGTNGGPGNTSNINGGLGGAPTSFNKWCYVAKSTGERRCFSTESKCNTQRRNSNDSASRVCFRNQDFKTP